MGASVWLRPIPPKPYGSLVQLNTFHDLVSGVVNRGTRYNSNIIVATRQAVRWIERKQTLKFMDKFSTFSLSVDQADLTFASSRIKRVYFIRFPIGGDFHYLNGQRSPKGFTSGQAGRPSEYWWERGTQRLVFSIPVDTAYDAEVMWAEYTTWPTDTSPDFTSVFEHWLLDNAEDLLMAQTMLFMVPTLKDPLVRQFWQPIRDEGLKTIEIAEDEFRHSDSAAAMRMYTG